MSTDQDASKKEIYDLVDEISTLLAMIEDVVVHSRDANDSTPLKKAELEAIIGWAQQSAITAQEIVSVTSRLFERVVESE